MSQNQDKINELMQLPKDILISRAMNSLRQSYPQICTPENGFSVENFGRITLRQMRDDLVISFGHVFTYLPSNENEKLIYNISLALISGEADYITHGYTFLVSSPESDTAIRTTLQAIRQVNRSVSDEEFYEIMNNELTWVIRDEGDYYQIETDSWHTHGWQKVEKKTLKIYDDKHKHYARTKPEEIVLYHKTPMRLFK